eukprot:1154519-Pelagomonas_calceolata.AAC.4
MVFMHYPTLAFMCEPLPQISSSFLVSLHPCPPSRFSASIQVACIHPFTCHSLCIHASTQLWAIPAKGRATSSRRQGSSPASAATAAAGGTAAAGQPTAAEDGRRHGSSLASVAAAAGKQDSAAPRMLACLTHQGLVTWDLQVCVCMCVLGKGKLTETLLGEEAPAAHI